MRKLTSFLLMFFGIFLSSNLFGHSVQWAYCITNDGSIRLYGEHWHGNLSIAATADAIVNFSVFDASTGITSNFSALPAGVVFDTPIGSLPDCKGPLNIVSACASANTYNDWAYWEFSPPSCFTNLTVTLQSVTGSDAFIFVEGCGSLTPFSLTDSFIDCVEPTVSCPMDMTVNAAESDPCGATFTDLAPTILFDDCTDTDDLIVTYTVAGATTAAGNGLANIFYGKGTSTVTYFVEDETGRIGTCDFGITVDDVTRPAVRCPRDLEVFCDDPDQIGTINAWLATFMSADACDDALVNTNDFDSGTITQTVTFNAADFCGNTNSCQASIRIVDSIDPIIITCPTDIEIECGEPNNNTLLDIWRNGATAVDGCSQTVSVTDNFTILNSNVCGGMTTVIFTATDGASNTSTCSAVISQVDSQAPEFLMKPQDITVECINANGAQPEINAWVAADGFGMAEDECDPTINWSSNLDGQVETCGHTYIRTYTFTITDDCGNTATSLATATVVDQTPPVLNLRADVTINCAPNNDATLDVFLDTFGRTSDVCSENSNITVDYVLFNTISGCGGTSTETYLFTATDECGNATTGLWDFTIQDNVIPTWVNPPGSLFIECGDEDNATLIQEWLNDIEASTVDACGGVHSVTNNWDGDLPDNNCNSTTPVIFTVIDDCGNVRNNLSRNIRVRDLINPVIINCPVDFTVNVDMDNCASNVIFSTPIGFDECTDVVTVNQRVGPASGSEFPVGTTRIVFEAVDDCGRRSDPDCIFNITVVDSATPSLDCPSDIEICADEGACTWRSDDSVLPMSSENCTARRMQVEITGATTLTRRNGTAENRVFQFGISTICYFLEDLAGNETTCCFDVIVSDCEAPTISCPEDLIVSCEATDVVLGASGNIVWNHNGSIGGVEGTSYEGDNNITQVVSTANDISFGPGLTLLNNAGQPTTIPNGSTFEHVLTDVATNTFAAAKAADDYVETCFTTICDAVLTQIQQGVVPTSWGGSAAGSYQVAAEISSDGFASNTLLYQGAQLNDPNAINNYVLYQEALSFPLVAGQTYCIRYYLYNEQNNAQLANGTPLPDNTVAFDDLEVAMTKSSTTGNGAQLDSWLMTAMSNDNCATPVSITSLPFNTIPGCGAASETVYEFTATDISGNVSQCMASFIIEDTTPPVITTAATDGDSDCDNANADLLDWLNNFGNAVATDECGEVTWSHDFVGGAMTGCSDVPALMVTFTATDECGNTSTTQANFEVSDTEPPLITCPIDITLECGDVLNDAVIELWLQSGAAIDNCTDPVITHNFPTTLMPVCGDAGTYTVTFTATDGCDNVSNCMANIIIEDSKPPVFLIRPQDLIVECGEGAVTPTAWLADMGGAIAEDECDNNLIWDIEEVGDDPGCGDSNTIEYNFVVEDACGNTTEASAFYIFEDTQAPAVIPPADITVECAADATSLADWQASASASDDCGTGFMFQAILFNSISGCGESMTEVYQFTATDACGNQGTALASYTVEDTTIPDITCPSDLTLSCGSVANDLLVLEWLDAAVTLDLCNDVMVSNDFDGSLPANCGGEVLVTFTGTDLCGNTADCTSTLVMDDTVIPDFVNCPEDLTINVDVDECGSNPIISTPVPIDNCDVSVSQTMGLPSGSAFPVGVTSMEFVATDECGNTVSCAFNVEVIDSDEPLILCPSVPIDACVDDGTCVWTSLDIGPTLGQENCPDFTIAYTVAGATIASGADNASGTIFELGVSTVCYTITDDSDNTSSCCFDVSVVDCREPEITCPADLTVECDGDGNAADLATWLGSATSMDNCSAAPVITSAVFNNISGCGGSEGIVYQFTAGDEAGNTANCNATFTTVDTTVPDITTAATNLIVQCEAGAANNAALLAWLGEAGGTVATDLCSNLTWSHDFDSDLSNLCGLTGESTITFTATDDCGNTSTTQATFTIEDTVSPVLTCPLPITLECGDVVNDALITTWLSTVTGTDACSEVAIVNDYPMVFVPDCGVTGDFTVLFTASDDCDNSSSCSSTILIEDTILPVFDLDPVDLLLECADGNNATLITAWLTANGNGVATDACSSVSWTPVALTAMPGCGTTSETQYLFTVTDDCGNSSTRIASVITENTTPPSITTPIDLIVECDGSGNVTELSDWRDTAVGASECGDVVVTSDLFNSISACGGGSEQVFVFTVTDDCGNQNTGLASFIIEDTEVPVPVCPATLILECGAEGNDAVIAAWLLSVDINDTGGCSSSSLTNNYSGSLPGFICDGDSGLIVQFTASDDCGNTGVCQSLITLNDNIDPIFQNCPTDIVVNVDTDLCTSNVVYSQPVALDQCDGSVSVALTSGIASGAAFPMGTTNILFTATDECGNTSTCTFNITVEDSSIPNISCPSNSVIVCTDNETCEWEATDVVSPIFSENCDMADFVVTYTITGATNEVSPTTGINDVEDDRIIFELGESEVCYTITDAAGNSSSCCFDVIVEDCEDPIVTCPEDLVVECDDTDNVSELANWLATASGIDNCDTAPEITNRVFNTVNDCGNTNSTFYEFTIVDDFGNSTTCLASFTIEDTTSPVINTPAATLSVECSGSGNSDALTAWLNNAGGAIASDLCNNVVWTHDFTSPLADACEGGSATLVFFTATDDCGNANTTEAEFIIEDTIEPVLDCPANITLECSAAINDAIIENWLNGVSGSDACSEVTIVNDFGSVFADACGETGVHTVTFTATDDCSNESSCVRTITLIDTTDPDIESEAQDLLLECADRNNATLITAWEANFGSALASDECSDEMLVWTIVGQVNVGACGGTSSTLYTFQVEDNCGNTSTTQASVIIDDTTPPVLTVPPNQLEECSNIVISLNAWRAEVTGSDQCGAVTLTSVLWNTTSGCGGTDSQTYLFTATDACGNETTGFADYIIEDTTEPTIVCPEDLELICGAPGNDQAIFAWLNSATATDDCGGSTINCAGDFVGFSSADLGLVTGNNQSISNADISNLYGLPSGSIIVSITNVNVAAAGAFFVNAGQTPEFTISGSVPVCIRAVHGQSITGNGSFDGITSLDGVPYNLTTPLNNFTAGGTPPNYRVFRVGGPTDGNGPFIWESAGAATAIQFNNSGSGNAGYFIELKPIDCPDETVTVNTNVAITHNYTGQLPADCNGSIAVTFTATDDCGNTSTCVADINVTDTTPPVFSNCPLDIVVNVDVDLCETNVVYSQPIALDDCGGNADVALSGGLPSGTAFPIGTTTVLFTATDECGNMTTCEFDITVVDSDVPSISCPSNDVFVCTDDGTCTWEATDESSAIFTDNCTDENFIVAYTVVGATTAISPFTGINDIDEDNIVFNLGESSVCYTISDEAGNSAQCCFDIIVEDCEAPSLTCSDELNVACGEEDLSTWFDGIAATMMDNCDGELTLDTLLLTDLSSCGSTFERVYFFTATDEAGNTSTCLATYETDDNIAPVITDAENLTLECSDGNQSTALLAWLNNNGGASFASDNCSADVSWTNDFTTDLVSSCGPNGAALVTFTATDDCGNTTTTTATFTIEDNIPPVLDCPVDITLECNAGINDVVIANWLGNVTSEDACQGTLEITENFEEVFAVTCGEAGVHTVTFSSIDDCDNLSSCSRTITIEDTTPPTIELAPQDLILECSGANNAALITAWESNNGNAVASDACSDLDLVWTIINEVELRFCGSTGSTSYTFQVADNCGNTATTQASVIIEDITAPTLILPEDQIEECGAVVVSLASWLALVDGSDECGNVSFTNTLWNTISDCGGGETMTYLFTATDICGNQTTGFADYSVRDTSPPTPACPDNLALICGNDNNDQIILNWLNAATAADANDCSSYTINTDFPGQFPILDCEDATGINITFTSIDDCGNSSSCIAVITMSDNAIPFFSNCPQDIIVNVDVDLCETNVIYSQPVALDDCDGNVSVVQTSGIASGAAFPLGTTSILYTAMDDCGNSSTCTFDITVLDSDIPSISCPSNVVNVCTDDGMCTWEATELSSAIFADNCADLGFTVSYTVTGATMASSPLTGINDVDAANVVFSLGVNEVCYTITDEADNSAQCCFDIIVEDCENPTLTCSDELNVACGEEDLSSWYNTIAATMMDNCDANSALALDTLLLTDISSCGSSIERIYMFVVTDAAGNTSSCLATYETDDTESPIIVDAEDLVLECANGSQSTALLAWLNANGGASLVEDNCSSEVVWTNDYTADLITSCGANGSALVTFTATDECGNTSTTQASFIIEDNIPPVLTCPSSLTLECSSAINDVVITNWLGNVTSEDACQGTLSISNNYEEVIVGDCGATGIHMVTFTTVDACDNISTCDRTITIVDTTPPTVELVPQDLVLECSSADNAELIADWELVNGGAVASDTCSDEDLVWTITNELSLTSCGLTGTTLYTFQVTDNCGNTATTQASVIIEDTTVPTLIIPETQVEECGAIVVDVATWLDELDGFDDCGEVTFSSILWNTVSGCGGGDSQTYLFTVTDACGNQTTGFSDYIIEDTTVPTPVCPQNLSLICGSEANSVLILNWLNAATATDEHNCSAVNIINDFPNDLPSLDCNGGMGIDITFTAIDACGNSNSCIATITMDDAEVPVFSNCPLDITVNVDVDRCESNVVYSQPIAMDNCDTGVEVALIEGIPSGNPFPLGMTTLTFEAVDDCGNTSLCSFDITVIDSDVPSVNCPSNDVVVCTDPNTCTWLSTEQTDPIFNDNCDGISLTYAVSGVTNITSAPDVVSTLQEDVVVFGLGTSNVVYTISDPSGNSSTCQFAVIVEDCQNPELTCANISDVACGEEDLDAWFRSISATAQDNCDIIADLVVDTLLLTDFSSCGNTFDRVYLYQVTDQAGNTAACVASYETDDNVAPVITAPAQNLTLECVQGLASTRLQAWLNNNGGAEATDDCSVPIVWTNDFISGLMPICGNTGEVLVTFTATDDCGNSSTTSATFRIEDTTEPELNCPDNITLECTDVLNDVVIANWLRSVSAEDQCQGTLSVSHDYSDVFVDGCGMTGVHTVTFTVADDCNNQSTCERIISIIDTTVPEIVMEAEDLILSCGSTNSSTDIQIWLDEQGGAMAVDGCSDEPLVWEYELIFTEEGCGGFEESTYRFIVTDNCGNTNQTTAMVTLADDTNPEFVQGPQDQFIECYPTGNEVALRTWLNNNGNAEVADECSTLFTWEYDLINLIDNCGNTSQRDYRFTVTDDCGNSSSAEASFVITDNTEPEIVQEASNINVECNGGSNSAQILSWLNNNGGAEATDRCGDLTWSNDFGTIISDCGDTGGVTVTFTATDDCGNTSTTTAQFIINDDTTPIWTIAPQNFEIGCDGSDDPMGQVISWLNRAGGGEALDDCSLVTITNDFSIINLECDMQGGVLVSFTATDACGNSITESAMLDITDDVPPVISVPAQNMTVECDGEGNEQELMTWLEDQANAEAEDACSAELVWNYALRSDIVACGGTSTSIYDFTATDACGNISEVTFAAFIVEDITDPSFVSLPLNRTVECDGEGNDLELDEWLEANGTGIADDICSTPVSWSYDLVMDEDSCGITGIQTFRFTITDDCGNTNTAEADFIIEDTTPPIITGGEDMSMEECDDNITGNILDFDFWLESNAGATATDICSDVVWTNDYDPANWMTTCGATRFVDVTFTATDLCGNSSSTLHRFGVGDVTPPTFINCPRPPVVTDAPNGWCNAFANYSLPVAEDNCSDATVTQVDDTGLLSGDLFPVGLTILTFVAEDECGNSTTCEMKIIVNDFTPPSIICGENLELVNDPEICGAIINNIAPLAVEDNCINHTYVTYTIRDATGDILTDGFEDASGQHFPVGLTTVEYTVADHPLLLISEIIQNNLTSGVEITNFGSAALDISCLDIIREGADPETHNVPNGIVLGVGDVYTHNFTPINPVSATGYYIDFVGRVIDGVSLNGYSSTNYTWNGNLFGENVIRVRNTDNDNADDFVVVSTCFDGSFGFFNPGLSTMTDNGSIVALQESSANQVSCSFTVSVTDEEPAYCAQYDTTRVCIENMLIDAQTCTEFTFSIPPGIDVGDINLYDLEITHPEVSDLGFTLMSPDGEYITLFNNLCPATANIDITLDDSANRLLSNLDCSPLGGDTYRPIEPFSNFFNANAGGTWRLRISNDGDFTGELVHVCLEMLELVPYTQTDVVLENAAGECGAPFEWSHPQINDNCGVAMMTVTLESDAVGSRPVSSGVNPGTVISEFFEVGTTQVIYTLTDELGNKSSCGFEVVVEDNEIPIIAAAACPDQVIQLAANQCFVPVSALTLPPVLENCPTGNISFSPSITGGFPSGVYPLTVSIADAAGNINSCSMEITVLPFEPPNNQMVCIGQINLSLDADCEEEIVADMLLAPGGTHGCTDDYCVTALDENGDEIPGAIATQEHVGQLLTVRVCTDCDTGNCCWGNVLIENKLRPEVDCPEPKISLFCNQIFEPSSVGEPILTTCEQEVFFSFEDNLMIGDMCDDTPATLERIWTVTDESNNTITCVQNITIEQFNLEDLEYPADTILTTVDISCADIALDDALTHPDHTGYPSLGGTPIFETGDGLCSHFWNWDDQLLMNCEGSYEILRRWLIRDMCDPIVFGINPVEHYQSIKVLDNMPPVIEGCPEMDIVANADFDCSTDILVNELFPSFTEICGSIKDTLISVSPGTVQNRDGQFFLTNMAPGVHTVKLTVSDQCSNTSRCEFDISVEDRSEPQVICEQDLHVALNNLGVAEVPAEVLDDGSFDNCSPIQLQIYRMDNNCDNDTDLNPGPYVTFCCNDVSDEPHQVFLRVWDDADRDGVFGSVGDFFSECMVRVYISDSTIPNLTCPDDIVINCNQEPTNLNITGRPSIGSACTFATASFTDDVSNLSHCATGEVVRTWQIESQNIVCNQIIRITPAMPFTINNIVWPQDFEGECTDMNTATEPIISGVECSQIGIELESDTFFFEEAACYKVINTWQVIDLCQFDSSVDPDFGLWSHQQVITITSADPPTITACGNITVDVDSEDCLVSSATISNSALANGCSLNQNLDWSYVVDIDQDGLTDASGTLTGQNVNFTIDNLIGGQALVSWVATDGCGNMTSCTQNVTVQDGKAPTALCHNLSTAIMNNTGTAIIDVTDIDAGSTDNCTAHADLQLSFAADQTIASQSFDCEDIPDGMSANVRVTLYVNDTDGNQSNCVTLVNLLDNNDVCEDDAGQLMVLGGQITTEFGEAIEAVETRLEASMPAINSMEPTDENGEFVFDDLPTSMDYRLVPSKNVNHSNGVNTIDVIHMQRHVLGLDKLNSPYKVIASDMNRDQVTNGVDLLQLRQFVLGQVDTFYNNTSWRFVSSEQIFADSLRPYPLDEVRYINEITDMNTEHDFIGVKIGDVDNTVTLGLNQGALDRRSSTNIYYTLQTTSIEHEYLIPVFTRDIGLIYGFQFKLKLTQGSIVDILPGSVDITTDNYFMPTKNEIAISWNGEKGAVSDRTIPLFYLSVKGIEGETASLSLMQERPLAEVYIGESLSTKIPTLSLYTGEESSEFILYQNEPNPFKEETSIKFYLPETQDVTITFYGHAGRELYSIQGKYNSGEHIIHVTVEDIGYSSVVYYKLSSSLYADTKKMIIID